MAPKRYPAFLAPRRSSGVPSLIWRFGNSISLQCSILKPNLQLTKCRFLLSNACFHGSGRPPGSYRSLPNRCLPFTHQSNLFESIRTSSSGFSVNRCLSFRHQSSLFESNTSLFSSFALSPSPAPGSPFQILCPIDIARARKFVQATLRQLVHLVQYRFSRNYIYIYIYIYINTTY